MDIIFFMVLLCQLIWDPFVKLKINTEEAFAGENGYLQVFVKSYRKNKLINQNQLNILHPNYMQHRHFRLKFYVANIIFPSISMIKTLAYCKSKFGQEKLPHPLNPKIQE